MYSAIQQIFYTYECGDREKRLMVNIKPEVGRAESDERTVLEELELVRSLLIKAESEGPKEAAKLLKQAYDIMANAERVEKEISIISGRILNLLKDRANMLSEEDKLLLETSQNVEKRIVRDLMGSLRTILKNTELAAYAASKLKDRKFAYSQDDRSRLSSIINKIGSLTNVVKGLYVLEERLKKQLP